MKEKTNPIVRGIRTVVFCIISPFVFVFGLVIGFVEGFFKGVKES